MDSLLQIPATIENVSSRSDGTWKISIGTQELGENDAKELVLLIRKFGWFLFKENPFEEKDLIDIPDFTPEFQGEKSPSQRLRSSLYILWEKQGGKEEFEVFYRTRMEKIITFVKEKLQ